MRALLYLALLGALAGYHGLGAWGHKGTTGQYDWINNEYDDYKGWVSCGCHDAPSCRQCGTQPHLCNGDCTWIWSKCSLKGGTLNYSWQNWFTNFTTGERSEAMYCKNGDHVTMIQLAREYEFPQWFWPEGGLIDLCFKCATEDKPQCFNGTDWWGTIYGGVKMQCSTNGFKSMTTIESQWYQIYPINVKAQCNDDNGVQSAFNVDLSATWIPWIACADGKKIVGFQVERNFWASNRPWKERIINFRFECA